MCLGGSILSGWSLEFMACLVVVHMEGVGSSWVASWALGVVSGILVSCTASGNGSTRVML